MSHFSTQDREDLRDEWYGFDQAYIQNLPKIYWVGLWLSAGWLVMYLLIYPSIPLPWAQTHWQGLGVPNGCQAWTAICEMRQGERAFADVRGRYLDQINDQTVVELAADLALLEFIDRAGYVTFADHCAACHGKFGAGLPNMPAPALNQAHIDDVSRIYAQLQNPVRHSFGLTKRWDATQLKLLAVYVRQLGHDKR
ncbi:MAG: hypothetical protein PHU06_00635 [Gallionella sp.]|nr:hypothetical protein [Gallionella sp.]MDD4957750.1 hypothetical protein [Gallionella sp.]